MSVPHEPVPDQPPMPAPGWKPEPPIQEPEPDGLPDELPKPNPDENNEPPKHVSQSMRHKGVQRFYDNDMRLRKEFKRKERI